MPCVFALVRRSGARARVSRRRAAGTGGGPSGSDRRRVERHADQRSLPPTRVAQEAQEGHLAWDTYLDFLSIKINTNVNLSITSLILHNHLPFYDSIYIILIYQLAMADNKQRSLVIAQRFQDAALSQDNQVRR